ncbi:MAG: hypothetical protein PHE83_01310 [Opitutaceae bacterium]|nr:hypothetical protein [Opitutaceae bacterium]
MSPLARPHAPHAGRSAKTRNMTGWLLEQIETVWKHSKNTRLGQLCGLMAIGFLLGLLALFSRSIDATPQVRINICLGLGGGTGVMLVLMLLVPSIFRSFIARKEKEGKSVWFHKTILIAYFILLVPGLFAGAVAAWAYTQN